MQLRLSLLLGLQYRFDFLLEAAVEVCGAATALVPLFVVFGRRESVAGWAFPEALLVTGFFLLLQGVLEGAINPSLSHVVEHVRKGTLDFVLLKPADAQFLVSTARFQPWRGANVVTAFAVFAYALPRLGRAPGPAEVAAAAALFGASTLLLYSLWVVTVSAAFYVVRVDNLTFLFVSVFDAARWPASVFRGALKYVFRFVVPLAVMTTFPAEALLGRLDPLDGAFALGLALAFGWLARRVWLRALSRYTSAGG
ncbi:MAG TPA: ABC-2 family transporter protein [Polyangiaceae bacterium]|nr:ABC-2 family transporter protein [Polyangiaceae bacterium]